ncbi:MAG: hypothetical protein JO013_06970 [Alphaproteobacteria bacterium]|nr:hypothetical protein [Alphaproteobacteria bacterium]
MRAIVLADLDDTLFQSRRKCPPDIPEGRLRSIAVDADGKPVGFATPRQSALLRWLSEGACVVPVTARSRAGLERVSLSWRYAVCAHGGIILEDGRPWPAWERRMTDAAAGCRGAFDDLEERLAQAGNQDLRITRIGGPSPLFLLAKHGRRDDEALAAVAAALTPALPEGWRASLNGNNLALLPAHIRKEAAVAALLPRLREQWPDAPIVGLGDSCSDAAFLRLCDVAAMPSRSQLARAALGTAP